MDETVTQFYTKNPDEGYGQSYDSQHGARLDAMVEHYNLKSLTGKKIADIGGGLGFLGKRLDTNNEYYVIDGAMIPPSHRLCKGSWIRADIGRDPFGTEYSTVDDSYEDGTVQLAPWSKESPTCDMAFCLETLEHTSNPYHCLVQIKTMVKPDGDIIISIPDETVWHNTIYPGLLWPRQNFELFLGQMSLRITDFWHFKPQPGGGWPAYHYRCINEGWDKKRMLYEKVEDKFRFATPLQMTNL